MPVIGFGFPCAHTEGPDSLFPNRRFWILTAKFIASLFVKPVFNISTVLCPWSVKQLSKIIQHSLSQSPTAARYCCESRADKCSLFKVVQNIALPPFAWNFFLICTLLINSPSSFFSSKFCPYVLTLLFWLTQLPVLAREITRVALLVVTTDWCRFPMPSARGI